MPTRSTRRRESRVSTLLESCLGRRPSAGGLSRGQYPPEVEIPEEGNLRRPLVQPPVEVTVEAPEVEPARLVEPAGRDVVAWRCEPDPRQPPLNHPGDRPSHQGTADPRPPAACVHDDVL